MIYTRHRCIFIHIPKTAGKSITQSLGFGWEGHKDLSLYAAELRPEVFQSYFKFAIVRNPWERLLSEYNYQVKKKRSKEDKLFVFDERGKVRSFAEWTRVAFADPFHYRSEAWAGDVSPHIHRWSPQVDWISVEGKIAVDHVVRMEHLNRDFSGVLQRLGLTVPTLPHRNRKLHRHYSHYYDDATCELVGRYYARDIEAFGYQFETCSDLAYCRKQFGGLIPRLLLQARYRKKAFAVVPKGEPRTEPVPRNA